MASKKRTQRRNYSKTKSSQGLLARRSLTILFLFLLVVAILFGLYKLVVVTGSFFFSENPHFELKQLNMSSDGRLSSSKLREYAAIETGSNLFAVDFKSIRRNLEAVPLIESIRIQRILPDTLIVKATERIAVAQVRWSRRGLPLLVDRHGKVLPATRTGRSLPLIDGLTLDSLRPGEHVDDSGIQYALEILAVSDTLGLGSQIRFSGFDLRYPEFVTAKLNDGVSARFPRHSAREKLIRLVRVLQIAQEQGLRVKTVDLTPDGRNVPTTYM